MSGEGERERERYRHNFDEANYIDLNVYLDDLICVYSLM